MHRGAAPEWPNRCRMAGMQAFALCERIAAAYCRSLAAGGCTSSQIAIVAPSAVPLWKVIVGPRADKLTTGPARVRFFLGVFVRQKGAAPLACRECLRASPSRSTLFPRFEPLGKATNGLDNPDPR